MAKKKEKKGEKVPVKSRKLATQPPWAQRFDEMLRRMDEEFEDMRDWAGRGPWWPGLWELPRPWQMRRFLGLKDMPLFDVKRPLVDIRDTGKDIVVEAEMAGIPKKNIDINLTEDSIEIRGEVESKEEEEEEGYYRRERSYSTCFRRMPLPAEVIPDKATAKLEGGILHIDIPKKKPSPERKGHKVRIK